MGTMEREKKYDGYVMQIQNFSVNDGEGIRTTIFLAGCPLRCLWCCNPEHTYSFTEEHHMTVNAVYDRVKRQSVFFRSNPISSNIRGGITFSGGEATVQSAFLRALTEHFYDLGYSLSLETCGDFEWEEVSDILAKMDLIFFDLKVMDPCLHKLFTDRDNNRILHNFRQLAGTGVPLVARIPLIVGVNAFAENISAACSFLADSAPHAKLEFLPYHTLALDKYHSLNLPVPDSRYETLRQTMQGTDTLPSWFSFADHPDTPSEDVIDHCKEIARRYGIETVSYR